MAGRVRDRDAESRRRRAEVLRLPMAPLRHHGRLAAGRPGTGWAREPLAVGIAPDGSGLARWSSLSGSGESLVTWLRDGSTGSMTLPAAAIPGGIVDLLPGDRVLVAHGRTRDEPNAEVWDGDGTRLAAARIGDAVEHLLSTADGAVWVAYFDEAMRGPGPQTHGLARFSSDLEPEWLYPLDAGLPTIFDCYSLNVQGETAYVCPYTNFHLLTCRGDRAVDLGPAPVRGAKVVLLDGDRGAMVGGYGPEYDLITPFRLTSSGIEAGPAARLVAPDGLEVRPGRRFARGPDLHLIDRTLWYRLDLDRVEQLGQ